MQIHIDPDTGRKAEQSLINFVWLLKLRWVAALGQLATVLTVDLLLGVELPLHYLLPLIAFEALSNLVFAGWLRLIDRRGGFGEDSLSTVEALLAAVMVLDLLLLTALLFATGGPSNPFCLFYLVNVLLGSLVLRPLWSFGLMGFGVLCFTLLFYAHEPLPGLPPLAGGSRRGRCRRRGSSTWPVHWLRSPCWPSHCSTSSLVCGVSSASWSSSWT
jgi:hypothetical protein